MRTLLELYKFLFRPIETARRNAFFDVIVICLLHWLLIIGLGIIFPKAHIENINDDAQPTQWYAFILIALGPIKEEFKYRFGLGEFNLLKVFVSVCILLIDYVLIMVLLPINDALTVLLYFSSIIGFVVIARIWLFPFVLHYEWKFKILYEKYYLGVFYGSAVLCALSHVLFSGQVKSFGIPFVFILHFTSAILLSYVRINFNIISAILVHWVFNAATYIMWLLAFFVNQFMMK